MNYNLFSEIANILATDGQYTITGNNLQEARMIRSKVRRECNFEIQSALIFTADQSWTLQLKA